MSTKPKKANKSAKKKKLTSRSSAKSKAKGRKKAATRSQPDQEEQEVLRRIGENIRRIRTSKGWVQEDMGDFGFAWRHYQRIEKGKRNLTLLILIRLAKALGVDISDLTAKSSPD